MPPDLKQREHDGRVVDAALAAFDKPNLYALCEADMTPDFIAWMLQLFETVRDPIVKLHVGGKLVGPWTRRHPEIEAALVHAFLREAENPDPLTGHDSMLWGFGSDLQRFVRRKSPFLSTYLAIASNPRYGAARQMFVVLLGRFDAAAVEDTLVPLLEDQDVQGHAALALRRAPSPRALPALTALARNAPHKWMRKHAEGAIQAIEKLAAKQAASRPG
ncbi:hypothetical protein LYSHEL_03600 [Lysobacter helvus]|uniref:HEAT repeat domain-containing protein n=2 Tax=Lysobacteraceae TaxID=32033 RepID=A0ABM7Q293_9GAMM|nr:MULTISPECIES: HEAT repeat domain-containing protein [Lysobacter]BCT91336.1 hypothetical protein LYSCAS_03600 [Lysobacter caseinilyticus]BCT94489.1 hypothetical protein LYSHEL_03600 [Lysobacter helvus]